MEKIETRFVAKVVKETLAEMFKKTFGIQSTILIQNGPKGQCQYVSPSAMKQFNVHRNKKEGTTFGCKTVVEFAKKIEQNFYQNEFIGSVRANEKGFLQIKVKDRYVQQKVSDLILDLTFPIIQKQKVVVDYSSPNIAKEMHVGHLRSTIIGQSVSRIFQFMGFQVARTNHVGDWGTQFGMLIAYMKQTYPDYQTNLPDIRDLQGYYKAARAKFDSNPQFKKLSQETVVRLQAYDQTCIKAWKMICQVSRQYFKIIYKRLNIHVQQYGESFYNKMIPPMLQQLSAKGLIVQDSTTTKKGVNVKKQTKKAEKKQQIIQVKQQQDKQQAFQELPGNEGRKAKCIFIQKYQIPLIVVKSDGGFNYDSTDLAAIQYRLLKLNSDRIVYITDSGQRQHFEMIIAAAKKAGWLTTQRAQHMGFGVILGQDGKKFKTRGGTNVKLLDLLNEAKQKALNQLKSRQKVQKEEIQEGDEKERQQVFTSLKPQEYQQAAQKLGIASIKYYDLKQNRISDYIFSFDKMLDPKGNTAIYLIYAYVRMCSIIRKSGLTSSQIVQLAKKKPFKITHPQQRNLAAMLIKFYDVLNESVQQLAINKVTDYIYEICVKVQQNYKKYRIIGDENMQHRIILIQAIRKVLEKAFYFVGIVPIEKI